MGLITDALSLAGRREAQLQRRAYELTKDNAKARSIAKAIRESGQMQQVRAHGGGVYITGADLNVLLALCVDLEEAIDHAAKS